MGYNKFEIEGILRKELRDLYTSQVLTGISETIKDSAIITGGSIVSLLLGEKPNDIDVYFSNPKSLTTVCNQIIKYMFSTLYETTTIEHGNGIPWEYNGDTLHSVKGAVKIKEKPNLLDNITKRLEKSDEKINYYATEKKKGSWISANAINLYDGHYQIITRHCGSPMDIHETFDFVHCISYYSDRTGLVLNKLAMEAMLAKELKYIGSKFPVSSLIRLNKFVKRGWRISNSEIVKICYDISRIDLSEKDIIAEQLEMYGMDKLFGEANAVISREELFKLLR